MLPESLPVERGKNHWYYTDAFQPTTEVLFNLLSIIITI